MIKNYSSHAANERTYLAWIRTAIALIGLGFIIGKFEYFLVTFYNIEHSVIQNNHPLTKIAGLVLISLAFIILIGSTVQFLNYKKMIDDDKEHSYGEIMAKTTLSVLLGSLIIFILFYTQYLLFDTPTTSALSDIE
tara:strand:+ start:2907 stop:3314 length:408 start_codon:yes stop_codon:yes gene_type:complete